MCITIRIPGRIAKYIVNLGFYDGHSIPVAKRSRKIKWFKWERKRGEVGARLWPPGGWVDRDTIKANKWWRLNPRPVVIPCIGFQVRTHTQGWTDDSWFYPEGDRAIQGALVTREGGQRVYMVTERNEQYGTKL
ncbi:MAG TPA: hypothetical protein VJT81_09865 [Burkholderiales bacterium]|nr:hypothetical protein [Burkholderiales bacterium]